MELVKGEKMKNIKWSIFFISFISMSLMFQACGGGGDSASDTSYEVPDAISIRSVDPIIDEVTDPESGEKVYIASTNEVTVYAKVFKIVDTYTVACSEVDNLEPVLLRGTWNNLTTGTGGELFIRWNTTYGSLWNSCIPLLSFVADLTNGRNAIEIFVERDDGFYYGIEELLIDNQ